MYKKRFDKKSNNGAFSSPNRKRLFAKSLVLMSIFATTICCSYAYEKGYVLDEATSGADNVITKYTKNDVKKYYDKQTGEETLTPVEGVEYFEKTLKELSPVEYYVNLAVTEYGDKNNSSGELFYNWSKSGGNYYLENGSSASSDNSITYYKSSLISEINSRQTGLSGDITSNFINSGNGNDGGAIYNSGSTIGQITGDFVGNNAIKSQPLKSTNMYGGAINNANATIGDIIGYFIGNTASAESRTSHARAYGGAIFNSGESGTTSIGNITGDFIGNSAVTPNSGATSTNETFGGAIYNKRAEIKDIQGNFIGNRTSGQKNSSGGAIYNFTDSGEAKIGNIEGDFVGNYSTSSSSSTHGGAIFNYSNASDGNAKIGNIKGDFIGNYSNASSTSSGGAIFNSEDNGKVEIGDIQGSFIKNYAKGGALAHGGAIFNYANGNNTSAKVGNIDGDFLSNYTETSSGSYGGAIANLANADSTNASIGYIKGDFINNYAKSTGSSTHGGAIYNFANGNDAKATIGDIEGYFEDNNSDSSSSSSGGAIFNSADNGEATIGDIKADFVKNYATTGATSTSTMYGGAIHNYANGNNTKAEIGNVDGSFISNYVKATYANMYGGAIANVANGDSSSATIGYIIGDFIDNYLSSSTAAVHGGAIYNFADGNNAKAAIDDIKGDFINNRAETNLSDSSAGAIFNSANNGEATIGDIQGSFVNNKASANTSSVHGGAIENSTNGDSAKASIGNIEGEFNGNYATTNSSNVSGGAIFNSENGGEAKIGNINADFNGNYVSTTLNSAEGGAIANIGGSIGDISGTFENNYAKTTTSSSYGGAISNTGIIKSIINSNFYNNYVQSTTSNARGGAIYTATSLDIVADGEGKTSTFSGNYISTNGGSSKTSDEAIYVGGSDITLTLKAQNKGAITFDDIINGDTGYSLKLTGDNTGIVNLNNLVLNTSVVMDSIILNIGATEDGISNVFSDSSLTANSGTISLADDKLTQYNFKELTSNSSVKWGVDVDFTNETSDVINVDSNSTGTISLKGLNFIDKGTQYDTIKKVQIIKGANGDETTSSLQLNIDNLDIKNVDIKELYKTTIVSSEILASIDSEIKLQTKETLNDSIGLVGLIYDNLEYITNLSVKNGETKEFILDDTMPIYTSNKDLTVVDDLVISGKNQNYKIDFDNLGSLTVDENSSLKVKNASIINTDNLLNNGTLTFENGGISNVTLENKNTLDFSGTIENSTITNNAEASIKNSKISQTDIINNASSNLAIENSSVNSSNITNDGEITLKNLTMNNSQIVNNGTLGLLNMNLNTDIQGANGTLKFLNGNITVNNKISGQNITNYNGANTNISDISLISDNGNSITMVGGNFNLPDLGLQTLSLNALNMQGGAVNIRSVDVDLAQGQMGKISAPSSDTPTGGVINVNGLNLLSTTKYNYTEINFADTTFANSVNNNVSSLLTDIYRYDVSYNPNTGNFGFFRGNDAKYFNPAILATPVAAQAGGYLSMLDTYHNSFNFMDSFMLKTNKVRTAELNANRYVIEDSKLSEYISNETNTSGVYVKPFAGYETVNFSRGAKVDNFTYGTFIGGDSELKSLKNGFYGGISPYISYIGSHQNYSGTSIWQNGGTLGLTGSIYKGNFFTGLTLGVGASSAEAYTMFGAESFPMLMSGAAIKSGYNFEFKEGRYIIQPSMQVAYTFVNSFDYTNNRGIRISSDPLNSIQLAPNLKFVMNTKNGFSPYVTVGMNWNIMNNADFLANEIQLPNLSVKPYVQYGVGIQKTIKDNFKAYGQVLLRNGGRNGIVANVGLSWAIGRDKKKKEKL